MKNKLFRIVSVILCLVLCFGFSATASAATADLSLDLSTESAEVGNLPSTISMTVGTTEALEIMSFSGEAYATDSRIEISAIWGGDKELSAKNINTGRFSYMTSENKSVTTWAVIDFTIPADLPEGTYTLGVRSVLTSKTDNSNPIAGITGESVTFTVTAASYDVTGVSLSTNSLELTVGGSAQLTATVEPANAANKALIWTSSNPAVATVDSTGKVTAVGAGTATITVTTADGGFTATCVVTVNAAAEEHTHALSHITAKAATCSEAGNIEYWFCAGCNKYFSDAAATTEITQAQTVIAIQADAHSYGDWMPNGTAGHKRVCAHNAAHVETAAHEYGSDNVCDVCNFRKISYYPYSPNGVENPFTDVAEGAYYYDAVLWAVGNGITYGTGDGTTFSPDWVCTRAQVVTFLWRAAGCPAPVSYEMPFTDVAADTYYSTAVLWAVEKGITTGTGDGTTFSPEMNCSRAQIVTFLWRAAGCPAVASIEMPFTDVAADAYYRTAVLWAVERGITTGTGDGSTFSPDMDCTRAQVVTFLYRNAIQEQKT